MYQPMRDYIIVRPDESEKIGGVLDMPQIKMNKPLIGTVCAVGFGLEGKPMRISVGDRIMYKQYAGWEIEFEGEEFLMMSEINDVLCIM